MLTICEVKTPENVEVARALIREYADSLGFDLSFQHFDDELANLPGDYAPPTGRLYLAFEGTTPAGCIALRKITDTECEMKRFYVGPLFRGKGVGKLLATRLIKEAKEMGYQRMLLDTVPAMKRAMVLYRAGVSTHSTLSRESRARGQLYGTRPALIIARTRFSPVLKPL